MHRIFKFAFCFLPLFAFCDDYGPWKEWDKGGPFSRDVQPPTSYFAYYLEKLHEINSLIEISDEHLSIEEIEFLKESVSDMFDKLSVLEQLAKERIYELAEDDDYEEIAMQAALWKKMKKKYRDLLKQWGSQLDAYKDEKVRGLKEKAYKSSTEMIRKLLEMENE